MRVQEERLFLLNNELEYQIRRTDNLELISDGSIGKRHHGNAHHINIYGDNVIYDISGHLTLYIQNIYSSDFICEYVTQVDHSVWI